MNYDQPRQLTDKTGWHYTSMNDGINEGRPYAIGYCRQHLDQPHPTENEARDCYTAYLITERLMLDGQWRDTYHTCQTEGCERITDRFAQVDGWTTFNLCDDHRNREGVAALFGQVGDSVHS